MKICSPRDTPRHASSFRFLFSRFFRAFALPRLEEYHNVISHYHNKTRRRHHGTVMISPS